MICMVGSPIFPVQHLRRLVSPILLYRTVIRDFNGAGRVFGSRCMSQMLSESNALLTSGGRCRLRLTHSDFYYLYRHISSSGNRNNTSDEKDKTTNSTNSDRDDKKNKFNFVSAYTTILKALLTLALLKATYELFFGKKSETPTYALTWNKFVSSVLPSGTVMEIVVFKDSEQAFVHVRTADNTIAQYRMQVPDIEKFESQIRALEAAVGIPPENWIPIRYSRMNEYVETVILLCFIFLVLNAFFWLKTRKITFKFNDVISGLSSKKFQVYDPKGKGGSKIKFKDVAGLHEAKLEVQEFIDYLKYSQKYTKMGAKLPKGALLMGPPGCGKTLLAKALATESSAPFISVNGTEFVEIIGGLGASRIRNLFKEAKSLAPCIIYIDEIDAIGRKRDNKRSDGGSEIEQTLNQLLVEMDGMDTAHGIIVLASTNRVDILDNALLRRGRFDRHILIDHPTVAERKEIFELYLSKIKLDNEPKYYSKRLAQMTPGFTGADIANVVNEAAIHAASELKQIVTVEELDFALQKILAGSEKRSGALVKEEREIIAYHESGHAIISWFLEHTDALLKVSIVPRTNAMLGFTQYSTRERKLFSKEQLFDRMCMMLGGRAAENIVFGRVTTGAEDDLKKVTKIAYAQVKMYGMNEKIGPLCFTPPGDEVLDFYKKPFSSKLQQLMDEEANRLVARAYFATEKLLKENRKVLEKLARRLLEKETLSYDDVKNLIGPPKYGEKECVGLLEQVLPE